MPEEIIQVVFKPVTSISDVNGYYETPVYTAANGRREYASAYASQTHPQGNPVADLVRASAAAHDGAASPYDILETETGDAAGLDTLGRPDHPLQSAMMARGADLRDQWAKVKEAYAEVGAAGITYSPLTQNSTATVASGIRPPTDNGMLGSLWTPAADNILAIPALAHARDFGSLPWIEDTAHDLWRATAERAPKGGSPDSSARHSAGMRP